MEPLWTPWRMPYIRAIESDGGCVFCKEVLDENRDPDLILHRGRHAFVVLNLYPYTTGHLMVVPVRHVGRLVDLTAEEHGEILSLLTKSETILEQALGTPVIQAGINIGRCAGAGVEGHLHVHLVPLVDADPVSSTPGPHHEPPEPLVVTRDRLRRAWERGKTTHSSNS